MIERNLPAWGRRELQELRRIEASLPAWANPEIRKLKRIMTKGDSQTRAFARLSPELCSVFH